MIFTFLLISCKSNNIGLIEGSWIDKETESTELVIEKSNGKYWIDSFDGKFQIKKNENGWKVTIDDKEYPVEYSQESNQLLFAGKQFIPKEESITDKFVGRWKNLENGTLFKINKVNGGLSWIVIGNSKLETHFYPKKTEKGFTFTYDEKQLFFVIIDDCIEDSGGNKYCRVF